MKGRIGVFAAVLALLGASVSVIALQGVSQATFPGSNGAIAYVCNPSGARTEICVANVDGTNQRQLTVGETFGNDRPAWSPDGSKIAFERRQSSQCCATDIYVMNANGNNVLQVTNTPATESGPAWSPDGSKLIFGRDDGQQSQLFVLTLSTLATQPIPGTVDGSYPSWSPDGSKIAFSSFAEGDQSCEFGPCVPSAEIFIAPAAGGSPTNITEHNEAHDLFPNWSTDSKKVVIERRPHPNDTTGRVLEIEVGGEHDFLSAGNGNDPTFSPNGVALAFDLDGRIHTSARPIESDDAEPVTTQTPLVGLHPDWQPCLNNACPSTAATPQTQSTTTVTATRVKRKIKASGTLTPPHPGTTMTVTLLKKKNGVFTPVKATSPVVASDGKFVTAFRRPGKGQCQVTARFGGDDDHSPSQASKSLKC
jgi:hypothetical protein